MGLVALPCRVDVQVYNERQRDTPNAVRDANEINTKELGIVTTFKGIFPFCHSRISESHPINTRTSLPKLPDALCSLALENVNNSTTHVPMSSHAPSSSYAPRLN